MEQDLNLDSRLAHLDADTDTSITAIHHTLGPAPTQASPGSHRHDGKDSFRIKVEDLEGSLPGVAGSPVYVLVRNNTGSNLAKGTIVYTNGATGNHVTVAPALANSDATSARSLGWVSEEIPTNTSGYVMIEGYLEGINTNAANDGDQLYLSPTVAGGWTSTKPYAPNHMVYVGVVAKKAGNGAVMVKVQNGYELPEIHDVLITSPTNGQALIYDSTVGLWKNGNAALSGVYTHTQGPASATWTIPHNLSFKPNVTIEDSGGGIIEGDVVYTDNNNLTITFTVASSGKAYLS
jgi:hypothetical protein